MQIQSHNTADVDQQLVIAGWQEHYQQMSAGYFQGKVVHLQLNGLEVFEEQMNTRIEQHFHAPAASLVFSFDTQNGSLYLLNEETLNAYTYQVLLSPSAIGWAMAGALLFSFIIEGFVRLVDWVVLGGKRQRERIARRERSY